MSHRTVVLFVAILAAFSPAEALWPEPRSIQSGSHALQLAHSFDISISGHSAPQDLSDAIARTKSYLTNDKLERLVVGRGASDVSLFKNSKTLSKLSLSLTEGSTVLSITKEAQKPIEERDEAYSLVVPSDGSAATLTANSTLGLFRGLTTFGQLWYEYESTTYALNTPLSIQDSPAYPYRGLMLDTARNFFPVADIKRTLDAMSWVKINQFHWHVVDSQSFALQIPGFTDLAAKGAYSSSMVYSPSDVQGIVSYAGEPPAGQLRFADATVTSYVADLFTAITKLFPSTLFSTGGDELNTNCYAADAPTQASLNATGRTLEQALDVFTQATHKALELQGKTPVVWEEMVLDHNVTLSPKHDCLDCGGGGWVGDFPTGNSWCDPFKTWQHSYSFDPTANLTVDESKLVLGGQHLLWTEQSGPQNLDPIIGPVQPLLQSFSGLGRVGT
ncbi:Beta-hexosaminidase 2 [Grifola frondosa]|uniref:beta-N-acetylhexosaminidase n=1 Tax=Grifola frondosa TaxID=5627 RepID=A0A1C7M2W4_GRIFR|nr:Beta-hexosaminidase 2 [Grifola frondosa]